MKTFNQTSLQSNATQLSNNSQSPKITQSSSLQTDDVKLKFANMPNIDITDINKKPINKIDSAFPAFPIKTDESFEKIENCLKNDATRVRIEEILKTMKSTYPDISKVFSRIFADKFLQNYSWNGKNEHKALAVTGLGKLITKIWKDSNMSTADFEKNVRIIIFQTHIRNSKLHNR